jgi:hypothetical protein
MGNWKPLHEWLGRLFVSHKKGARFVLGSLDPQKGVARCYVEGGGTQEIPIDLLARSIETGAVELVTPPEMAFREALDQLRRLTEKS